MISAIPSRPCRSRSSSMICAWVVTSSAVVASSAISSFGSAGECDRDHHALAHAARELVRVLLESLAAAGQSHELEQLERAVARGAAVERSRASGPPR